jgi:nucleotide-binding universal stress UspA family protein
VRIHVVSVPASSFGYPIRPYESLARIEQERLKVFVRANLPPHISCEAFVKIGDAKHEILAAADEGNVDLTVMASRRRSGIPRLVLGSVAEGVLRGSNRPVLIVRPETP